MLKIDFEYCDFFVKLGMEKTELCCFKRCGVHKDLWAESE